MCPLLLALPQCYGIGGPDTPRAVVLWKVFGAMVGFVVAVLAIEGGVVTVYQ